jgi:DNA-binding NarL/FixJ family response regulator
MTPGHGPTPTEGILVTRVLIVDDHDFFRGCLVDLVNASHDLEAVGECTDGAEVAAAVLELQPDVVLMDVRMRSTSGLEAAAMLQQIGTGTRVLMFSSDTARSSRAAAKANGACGYLFKGSEGDQVLEAIRQVASGGTVWPEDGHGSPVGDATAAVA